MTAPPPSSLFDRPASVILIGEDRPLLNWVALALASSADPGFLWLDVRALGGLVADTDPLSGHVIPPERLAVLRPSALTPDDTKANIGVSAVVRADEPPENLQILLDFLRLPERTQARLSEMVASGQPRVAVLSNAHRLGGYYPVESIGPMLRAIQATGVISLFTFADAPNDGRFAFDIVLRLEGRDPKAWRQATLRVEKGLESGPFRTDTTYRLAELDPVAKVLAGHLG